MVGSPVTPLGHFGVDLRAALVGTVEPPFRVGLDAHGALQCVVQLRAFPGMEQPAASGYPRGRGGCCFPFGPGGGEVAFRPLLIGVGHALGVEGEAGLGPEAIAEPALSGPQQAQRGRSGMADEAPADQFVEAHGVGFGPVEPCCELAGSVGFGFTGVADVAASIVGGHGVDVVAFRAPAEARVAALVGDRVVGEQNAWRKVAPCALWRMVA